MANLLSTILSGNNHITFGPNSTWASYLRVGGNGHSVSSNEYASVVTTNGNLHLDAGTSRGTYINYYAGTAGTAFGNGASSVVAWMGPDGDLWKGGSDNSGTQYVYNSGTWGISITGNADTVDGKHATNNANNLAVYESNGYLYIPSWMNVNGGGIFSGTNNAHLRPNTGAYGAWEMIGSKNGWSGIYFNDSGDYLMANNNEVGHYQSGTGWKFRWYQGEMYISSGTTGGGTERTVIHSGNIGSQSVNYASSAGNSSTTSQIVFSDLKTNFPSGDGGGHSFASSHYSMGLDSGNGGWSHPHYRDLIIGYHTGVRIGAHYSGIRFYNNSPTTDANNDGNGDGGEALLMTIGGYVGTANHTDVVVNNNLFANVSMRAPIFYDSNDTGYYLDPNSSSYLHTLVLSGANHFRPNSWVQFDGTYGLYAPTNNAHFRPNPNNHGPWLVTGTRNGWSGIEFESLSNGNVNLMIGTSSNISGFHNNSYGWQFYWEGGTLYCRKNNYGGGTTATVWDSSNAPRANFGNLMYYQGFELDANTMSTNSTGFTYANNAPFYGPIARFSTGGGYDLWIGGAYSGGGNAFYLRTRNGDAGTFNAWREIITSGNIASQSVSYAVTSGTSSATTQTDFSELSIGGLGVATREYVTSQGYLTSLPAHNHDDRYYTESESDSRFVNVSGDTMSGSLSFDAAAVIKKKITGVGDNPVKTASGVLASRSDNGGGAAYYIIETNVPQDEYQMGGFTIELFGRYGETNNKTKIDLGGYWNPEGNGGFIGFEAHGTNPQYKPTIEVARNNSTGKTAFIIYGVSWSYPIIVARDLWLGYNSTDGGAYGEGWVIASASNLDNYSNRDTVVWRNAYSDSNPSGYISGNQTITLSGDVSGSGTTSISVTVDSIDGWGFVNTGSNSGTNADTINSNGISYYTGGVTNFSGNATDGALYSQRYSDNWQHQIAGDYRSGMIAVRGKNNGTWTSWKTIIDSSTIGSQSVNYASSAGNADTTDGLHVHGARNNEADKIVRTDSNGYIQAGWINTTSGDEGNGTPDKFYGSNDNYIRYYTRAYTQMYLGLTYKYTTSRRQHTTDTNYWTGTMGWGTTDWNDMFHWGSGFLDSWSNPGNQPPSGDSHHTGLQVLHYTNGSSAAYGWQMAGAPSYNELWHRHRWGGSFSSWRKLIDSNNIGSQSVNYAVTSGTSSATTQTNFSSLTVGGLDVATREYVTSQGYLTSLPSHNHDDRYYTESEVNTLLAGKLNTGAKAADSETVDGVDSSAIVYGGSGRASNYVGSMDDRDQKSGFYFKDGPTGQPFGDWWNWMTIAGNLWQSSNNYSFQIAHAFHSDDAYIRRMTNGTAYSWRTLITSGNIGSQSVSYASTAGSASSATTATTANRLERYGVIYGDDWNSYYQNNRLLAISAHGHSGSNRPSTAYTYGSGLSYYNSGSDHYQFFFPENSSSSNAINYKIHYRSGWNGNWGGWRQLLDMTGNVAYISGNQGTGIEISSGVGYNQSPDTFLHLKGQGDYGAWRSLYIDLRGDASGQAIVFSRIQEGTNTKHNLWYIPKNQDLVIFEYQIEQQSDSRKKDNISTITNAVDKVKQLRGVEFDWNSGVYEGKHDIGVIAQDVEAVLPEAVSTQEDGYKTVSYTKLIPLLIETVKEQQAMIEQLSARLSALEQE